MKLRDRDLSYGLAGPDVQLLQSELRLLGYEIRASELQEQIVGDDTEEAIKDFQRKRGLRTTGEVDAQTARLINAAVDALPPREFTVKGRVLHEDGTPLSGLSVRAFDRDLRREEPLGEGPATTDEAGYYRITYTTDQFASAEKRSAELVVRVFSPEGALPAASELIFDASS